MIGYFAIPNCVLRNLLAVTASTAVITAVACGPAQAGCNVTGTQVTWDHGGSGDWNTNADWGGGHVPQTGDSVCIVDGTSTVTLDESSPSIDNLQLAAGNTLAISGQSQAGLTLTITGTELENAGLITLGGGNQAKIEFANNTVLSGGGTIELEGSLTTGFLEGANSNGSLTNKDNTIEGSGVIGGNDFAFTNEGTVNANGGGELLLTNMSASTNSSLLEATHGADLVINDNAALNNAGGTILADGGTVTISSEIDGGTLQTMNGGTMQTRNGLVSTILNGVTLAAGSTYLTTVPVGGVETDLEGTITNHGTFVVSSNVGGSAVLALDGSVSLQGGGTIQLGSSPSYSGLLEVESPTNATFTNVDNKIEGSGDIDNGPGAGRLSFVNDGSVIANVAGQTLYITVDSVTNNDVFEADSGAAMFDSGSTTNLSGNTLTGGTYNAVSGTIEFERLGLGGGEILNNAATILLSGTGEIIDDGHSNAMSAFANNEAAGSFTTASGAAFSTTADFNNDGMVTIGSTSSFTDTHASSTFTNQNDGELQGGGTVIVDDLFNYGTVRPGDPGSAGTLTLNGNFTQGSNGTLEIDIAGTSQYSQLDVNGHTKLNGSTLAVVLLNSFSLASGELFDILNTDPFSDDFGHFSLNGVACTSGGTDIWECSNLASGLYLTEEFLDGNDQLWLQVDGQQQQGVPEPDSLALLGSGLVAATMIAWRRRKGRRRGQF